MKRGTVLKDANRAFELINSGKSLFHECVVMSAAQLKTRSIGWLIGKIKEGKLYLLATPEVTATVRRYLRYEEIIRRGVDEKVLECYILITSGLRVVYDG